MGGEKKMKKIIVSLGLMLICLVSTVSVFAASGDYISDSYYYRKGYYDNGYAILYSTITSSGTLYNTGTKKGQYGDVTVSFGTVSKTSRRASVTATFKRDGVTKHTQKLSIASE